ncbi:hypothetical protein C9994_09780 [Marivirga lumbricoides]|uniref:Uncharacterized protein n=1 Tax=Marivirga lumbricoides TaxID=1046115 RepID=A0A2T4DQ11_9BACT|nr:hypothetical protein C9994_09780 [Marivirga lumbricoides]
MFEPSSIISFRFVQRNTNKSHVESYNFEYIYCFLLKTEFGCSKYIVTIKKYPNALLTIDFYRKIKSNEKYKVLSNDFKFGRVGATILDIMRDVQTKTDDNTFGILASSMLEENNNKSNKRFKVYIQILTRKVDSERYKVFGTNENSFIFVIPIERTNKKKKIFLEYETIFKETN